MKNYMVGAININKHHLLKQALDVIVSIEDCGASDKLTDASCKADALLRAINKHIDGIKVDERDVIIIGLRQAFKECLKEIKILKNKLKKKGAKR
jgi:hypothetical protein